MRDAKNAASGTRKRTAAPVRDKAQREPTIVPEKKAVGITIDPIPHIEFRPGAYAPGRKTMAQILEAALDILINEGIRAVTLRRIAAACDLRIGNVTYHFATKNELLRAVLDVVAAGYSESLRALELHAHEPPELRLSLLISFILEDIQSKATTNLFPELWALSNHDPFFADCINDIYRRGRELMVGLISEINPNLDAEEREVVATFVQAATEGMTIFAGHNKPFADRMPLIESLSIKTLVDLVKSADSKTIRTAIVRSSPSRAIEGLSLAGPPPAFAS